MLQLHVFEWAGLLSIGLCCAGLIGYVLKPAASTVIPTQIRAIYEDEVVFLFEQSILIDASPEALDIIGSDTETQDWSNLARKWKDQFPDFPTTWQEVRDADTIALDSAVEGDSASLLFEWVDGVSRIHYRPGQSQATEPTITPAVANDVDALRREMLLLQTVADMSPYPIWMLQDTGMVAWHNDAYANLYEKLHNAKPIPERPILQTLLDDRKESGRVRASITIPATGETNWFDISVVRHSGFNMYYSQDIDAVVRAEVAQRNFVQTLAKTFAQLSTGLAIFDRQRQLVLFNPALLDLTTLSAEFLATRPDLLSFFDRLRDLQMMPEPRNYNSWREQMADLVDAASDGRYQETWALPSGSTYQVSGRPHPDGAIAFLFEDITAEVTLTRRFRSELETGQAIIDSLEDAIAVFSPTGILTYSNAAYCRFWSVDPELSFADISVKDAIKDWQNCCNDGPVWSEVEKILSDPTDRDPHDIRLYHRNDDALLCQIRPVQGGARMVLFRNLQSASNNLALEISSMVS